MKVKIYFVFAENENIVFDIFIELANLIVSISIFIEGFITFSIFIKGLITFSIFIKRLITFFHIYKRIFNFFLTL